MKAVWFFGGASACPVVASAKTDTREPNTAKAKQRLVRSLAPPGCKEENEKPQILPAILLVLVLVLLAR